MQGITTKIIHRPPPTDLALHKSPVINLSELARSYRLEVRANPTSRRASRTITTEVALCRSPLYVSTIILITSCYTISASPRPQHSASVTQPYFKHAPIALKTSCSAAAASGPWKCRVGWTEKGLLHSLEHPADCALPAEGNIC